MNVKTAHAIDYWTGIPLCFILSFFRSLKKLISGKRKRGSPLPRPQKILFLKIAEIGSAILAYPVIAHIKASYPTAEIYFFTFRENRDAIHLLEIIPPENILTLRQGNLFLIFFDLIKNIRRMRSERIDTVIDLELFSRFSNVISYFSGAVTRAGFYEYSSEGLYRGNLCTHRVAYNPYFHISKNFLALAHSLLSDEGDIPLIKKACPPDERLCLPGPRIDAEKTKQALLRLRSLNPSIDAGCKIVIVNIGFNDRINIRRWPVENYIKLIDRLLEVEDVFVVLAGVDPAPEASALFKNERCLRLIGKTTVEELFALFHVSHVLVSHDCGLVHLASLTPIPIIAFFGPETPSLYGPLTENTIVFYKNFMCSPCLSAFNYRRSVCKDNRCLQAISIDEVYKDILVVICPPSLLPMR